MKKLLSQISSYAILIGLMIPSGALAAYDDSFRLGMKNEILNAFELVEKPKEIEKPKPKEGWETIKANIAKLWTKQMFPESQISPRERLEVAFEQLPPLAMPAHDSVLDLELLSEARRA